MAEIEFVDQTIRDGTQSMWGMRMRAGMVTEVAEHLDRAGFREIEVMTSYCERLLRENKWDRLDWLRKCLPNTKLRMARLSSSTGGLGISPHAIMDLMIKTQIKHGINSFWVLDCLYNMPAIERVCRTVANEGAEVLPAIMFGDAPVLTDEFFADKVRQYVSWGIADAIFVEDAPGILRPERCRTLMRALVDAAEDIPVELHCHNTTGLAPVNYLEAIEQGVRILHTACDPLANGMSLPSTEMMLENLSWLGHTHRIDTDRLAPVSEHFRRIAVQEGFEIGAPVEYNVGPYFHHMPGGATGTLKASLAQHKMEDRLSDVLREIPQVREDLGHPVSATPYSQFMGIQAVLNITTGDRYSVVPDELIMYALGHFGSPPAPINPDVLDRILENPRAKQFIDWEPPQPTLKEIRSEYGTDCSDEELLCRYLVSPDDLEATKAAGLLPRCYELIDETSVADLLTEVIGRTRSDHVHVSTNGVSLTLDRAPRAAS